MSEDIVRAGSVMRRTKLMKRWKPAWIVVYANGNFSYFANENVLLPRSTVHLPTRCHSVFINPKNVDPPSNRSKTSIFGFSTERDEWLFSADSYDDAVTWCTALNEAKAVPPRAYPVHIPPAAAHHGYTDGVNYYRYSAYPQTTVPLYDANYPSAGATSIPTLYRGTDGQLVAPRQIIEHPDGSRTIILDQGNEIRCHCCRGYDCGCGYGFGEAALLGLAASSLVWSPFLWSPLFWC